MEQHEGFDSAVCHALQALTDELCGEPERTRVNSAVLEAVRAMAGDPDLVVEGYLVKRIKGGHSGHAFHVTVHARDGAGRPAPQEIWLTNAADAQDASICSRF